MKITGLHILLTYQCTFECEHCFAWGSPWQSGTLTLQGIRSILKQAKETGFIQSIYFEGGEPFLYYPILLEGVREAASQGFHVGIVTNSYWATTLEDAIQWLQPLAGLVEDLSVSSDLFHYSEKISQQAQNASAAASKLGIPLGMISVAQPEAIEASLAVGQLPIGESGIMYRGRATTELVKRASRQTWTQFDSCPYEDLRNPGRLHLDPLGNLHICQGITIGNLFTQPLEAILEQCNPETHPIVAPLLLGGPAELVQRYDLPHQEAYADACHLCYTARVDLRDRFPDLLTPDQMYGVIKE
jgi:hypothetical protein